MTPNYARKDPQAATQDDELNSDIPSDEEYMKANVGNATYGNQYLETSAVNIEDDEESEVDPKVLH